MSPALRTEEVQINMNEYENSVFKVVQFNRLSNTNCSLRRGKKNGDAGKKYTKTGHD